MVRNLNSLRLAGSAAALCLVVGCSEKQQETTNTAVNGSLSNSTPDFTLGTPVADVGTPSTGNNGSEGSSPNVPTTPNEEWLDFIYDFKINNGALVTHGENLDLSIQAPSFIQQIRVSTTSDCSAGNWIPLSSAISIPVPTKNANNVISIQYKDFDQAIKACAVHSIKHDNKGPDILISKYPTQSLEVGVDAELAFNVTDISAVKSVKCTLTNDETLAGTAQAIKIEKECRAGAQTVNFTGLPVGTYTFTIKAEDEWGYQSGQIVRWVVVNGTKLVNQTVKIADDRKVDILFVIDNSGSMGYEQKNMAARVGTMLNVIKGLDWQIAATTTDPTGETPARSVTVKNGSSTQIQQIAAQPPPAWADGQLLPFIDTFTKSSVLMLNSSMDQRSAQAMLGATLQRKETGSGSEQAIYAVNRFIERSKTTNSQYKNFFRENSNFAVVVISDEDESANGPKNDPENLIKTVSASFTEKKVFTWHSIIAKPKDVDCIRSEGAAFGYRYDKLSRLTGGLIGSVCAQDYGAQVAGIAEGIRNMNKSLALTCTPISNTAITVKLNGVKLANSFTLEGLNLKFQDVLQPGTYSLEYQCLKN